MIPKIIHYCWFGGKQKPNEVNKYIASWRKFCPDYEIREWNESNFDITENDYCREAYEAKKWAFVTDYARLAVLYKFGGIYMDTDVELVKPFDSLLNLNAFMCFEDHDKVSIGTFGVAKAFDLVKDFLVAYQNRHFCRENGSYDTTTNLEIVTQILHNKYHLSLNGKLQTLSKNVVVYPREVFIAKSVNTGWIMKDDSTIAIHHYAGSWFSEENKKLFNMQSFYLRKYLRMVEDPLSKVARYHSIYNLYGFKVLSKKALKHLGRLTHIKR